MRETATPATVCNSTVYSARDSLTQHPRPHVAQCSAELKPNIHPATFGRLPSFLALVWALVPGKQFGYGVHDPNYCPPTQQLCRETRYNIEQQWCVPCHRGSNAIELDAARAATRSTTSARPVAHTFTCCARTVLCIFFYIQRERGEHRKPATVQQRFCCRAQRQWFSFPNLGWEA